MRFMSILVTALVLTGCARLTGHWSQAAAAAHLDRSARQWLTWPAAAREGGTVCISCHSALPYLLARHALSPPDQNAASSQPAPQQRLLASVRRRVQSGTALPPYYPRQAVAARGTEAVLNALILTDQDAGTGHLSVLTGQALAQLWALQIPSGGEAGSWPWIEFHNEPWEAPDSPYVGATFAALAIGRTPPDYRASAAVQDGLQRLQGYLIGSYDRQPLLNRIDLLWASGALPQLLPASMKSALLADIWRAQRPDGGWNTAALMPGWKRRDGTPQSSASDGYATGLVALAMQSSGVPPGDVRLQRALRWLRTHQSFWNGGWPAKSLNAARGRRDFEGHFMSDAATAYAVLALSASRARDASLSRTDCRGCARALAAAALAPAHAPTAPP